MKLRIKDSSLRLRLEQKEVEKLVRSGALVSKCILLESEFVYALERYASEEMEAAISGNKITVRIPGAWIEDWHVNEKIGFDCTMPNGTYILVEKDYKCLIPREHEDESDMYANPRSNA